MSLPPQNTREEILLTFADHLTLPLEAVTQTFAVLAIKGSGKTYLMLKLAEEMIEASQQVIIIDPVGVCWGLRSDASGTGPGLPVIIMGGEHGDVPLEASFGEIIADFLIESRQSAVLDLSSLRKRERQQFVTEFAEQLYRRNRHPLHLIIDEADLFAPQRVSAGEMRMLDAIEELVRRGRAHGIGVTLATQRSQVINKDVVTQAETLMVLRTIASWDLDAIETWTRVHGTREQQEVMLASLPSLPTGTAWVWSPGWLKVFQQVQIGRRKTFDSSATPKVGEIRAEPTQLAQVDLQALRKQLAATIETAKVSDPKLLKLRIEELEQQLAAQKNQQPAARIERVEIKVEVPVFQRGELERLEAALLALRVAEATVAEAVQAIGGAIPARLQLAQRTLGATAHHLTQPPSVKDEVQLRAGERKLLDVLARHYPMKVTRAQLGTLSGYAASGGTFSTYLGTLKRAGYLSEQAGNITLTEAGRAFLGIDINVELQTRDAFIAMWMQALRAGERKMLSALLAVHPQVLTREELAAEVEMTASGGTFGTYLGTLRRNGLVIVEGNLVYASDLFAMR